MVAEVRTEYRYELKRSIIQEFHALLVQTSLGLNGNPQHYIFFHILQNKRPAFEESRSYKTYKNTAPTLDLIDSIRVVMM